MAIARTADRAEPAATLRARSFSAIVAGAVAGLVLGFPFAAQAQQPIVIKFSHVTTPDTPKGKGTEKFKQLAEQYTSGKVKVEIYPNSQLYKDKEEIEALQLGAVQLLAPSTSKFAPIGIKEFEALDLPFIFPDEAAYLKATKGVIGKALLQKLDSKGITGLAFWDNGFHMISANKPLRKPRDLQGLKIRISGSKVADAYLRAMGALPQIIAFSELYQALQTGVVDGCENTPSNYYTQKLHEVQKHINVMNHAHLSYAVIANKKFWDGLPADIRVKLEQAMQEATDYTNSIASKENADALAAIKASGKSEVYAPTKEEREEWRQALVATYKSVESRVGKDIIVALQKETAAVSQ
ncbi:MAG TPA: TRAP transporter substrate-binding protein [Xanthobacteraceae bacterium]